MKLSNHIFKELLLIILLIFIVEISSAFGNTGSPQKVILDADIDSDVDDVGALAILLNLRYTKFLAEEFPSELKSWQNAEEASTLYRKLLAENPNESVIIITIGHLTNLQQLLQSQPDQISKLNGKALVNKKVNQWICMGGQYPSGKEANFYRPDPASTVYCVNNWKKDVVFCGWEAGNPIITGGIWLKENLSPVHPVYRAYQLYNNFAGRQSWDQLAILQLVNSTSHFFSFVNGNCIVNSDGSNGWVNSKSGKHQYMVLNPQVEVSEISNFIDRLMINKILK